MFEPYDTCVFLMLKDCNQETSLTRMTTFINSFDKNVRGFVAKLLNTGYCLKDTLTFL